MRREDECETRETVRVADPVRTSDAHPVRSLREPSRTRCGQRVGSVRRDSGSVVTYAVAIFMLLALMVYLAVAFFAEEPDPGEVTEPVQTTEHDH